MKNNIKNKIKNNSGYAVLETIFYIVLFAILSIAVINALITMTQSFKETAMYGELMQGGDVMERMSRDIRNAYGINSITSTSLKLNTKDTAGVNKTVEFNLSGNDVRLLENDSFIGNLNTANISITNLSFTQINTTKGSAIKILLSLRSNHDALNRIQDFYTTVVLRGDY